MTPLVRLFRQRPALVPGAFLGTLLLCAVAWGAGIRIPADAELNIQNSRLNLELVSGGTVENSGTIRAGTGKITLNGDWQTGGAGYYISNAGTVDFSAAAGVQSFTPGDGDYFDVVHSGGGTLQLAGATTLDIGGDMDNLAGVLDAAGVAIDVSGDWNNLSAAPASFVAGGGTVRLLGAAQTIRGASTFYHFSKPLSGGADTLTFPAGTTQTITRSLTLRGDGGGARLSLRSSTDGVQAFLALQAGAAQDISDVDVKDNNASGLTLVAQGDSLDSLNNTNWSFSGVQVKWDGSEDSNWENPFNWNLGFVPGDDDAVIIRVIDENNGNAAIPHQPVLTAAAHVDSLEVRPGASLTLDQRNLTVDNGFILSGDLTLDGNETVTAQSLADTGTITWVGMQNGSLNAVINENFVVGGGYQTTFHKVVIQEENTAAQRDTFAVTVPLTVTTDFLLNEGAVVTSAGGRLDITRDLTAASGTFAAGDAVSVGRAAAISGATFTIAGGGTLTAGESLAVTAGTLDAQNGSLDAVDVLVSGGTLAAPSGTFSVSGDFTFSGGTFTHNNGAVVLDGTDAGAPYTQTLTGSATFYDLSKQVPAGATQVHTLVLASGSTQTIEHSLTLTGLDAGHRLVLQASSSGSPASLNLLPGGLQTIANVAVQDNTASGLKLVARGSSLDNTGNTNWAFGATTIKWDGSASTDWNNPLNWHLGIVPQANDTVFIRSLDEDFGNAVIANQPVLSSAVSIGSLTLRETDTVLDLAGFDLSVQDVLAPPGTFANNGTVRLRGTEALLFPALDTDSGTFEFRGDNSGGSIDFTAGTRPAAFYNVIFNDLNGSPATFVLSHDLTVNGSLTVNGGSVDAGSNGVDLAGALVLTGGDFTAPGTGEVFTIAGDVTVNGGLFTHNGGKVTLDGTSSSAPATQTITGNVSLFDLSKEVAPGATQVHTLVFDHNGTVNVADSLTLRGISGNALLLRSDSVDSSAAVREWDIALAVGGIQAVRYVDVRDSDASGGVALVARDSVDHEDSSFNNTNWVFGIPTVRWDGSASTDWGDPFNWDLGLVPLAGDNVVIRSVDPLSAPPNQHIANQPLLTALSGGVAPGDFTLDSGSTLTADGFDLTVSGTLSNDGNILLTGGETVTIATVDTDSGTFTITGEDTGVVALNKFNPADTAIKFYNLVLADTGALDVFRTQADIHIFGVLHMSGGTLDISTGSDSLTVDSATTIDAGALLSAGAGDLDLNGAMAISGTVTAPGAGRSFTVAGDWSLDAGGVFTANGGQVTLDTPAPAVITGSTTFYGLRVSESAGKTVTFQAGSTQTVTGDLYLDGGETDKLVLRSSVDGSAWLLAQPAGSRVVTDVDVRDGTAVLPGGADILALNAIDSGNNVHWTFGELTLIAPDDGTTVGPEPVIIGRGVPGGGLSILDKNGTVVATAVPDADGNFRVAFGDDAASLGTVLATPLPAGGNALAPFYAGNTGRVSDVTVEATPAAAQVPVIATPSPTNRLTDYTPTLTGTAAPGATIYIVANDEGGHLALTLPPSAYLGQGTVAGDGTFSVTATTALPRGTNYISVVVNGVSSALNTYQLNDIHGFVFDSDSNQLVRKATVTLYRAADDKPAVVGTDIAPDDVNPVVTTEVGDYSFLATHEGDSFYIRVAANGYQYPTTKADTEMPDGRHVMSGSRGEPFTIGASVFYIDQPMDGAPNLFRIEKTANKGEARIGEVVTYAVTIESLQDDNTVIGARLHDIIPPGFKYLSGRVQLDGVTLTEPSGNRPLQFDTGDFAPRQTKTLRYQLVIGSGVIPGGYDNVATMRYPAGTVLSNRSSVTVKVVMDPLFDAGTVFGKVFYDLNGNGRQDAPDLITEDQREIVEEGVPNVRLVMEDGTVITADQNGQFHVPGLLAGRHLLRLDERTLPAGAVVTTDKVQVVDVTPGMLLKVNFGVDPGTSAPLEGEDSEILVDQNSSGLAPRLNLEMFRPRLLIHNGIPVEPIELRMFLNYAPFITGWSMDIVDRDTGRVLRSFAGNADTVHDPVLWDGRDASGAVVASGRNYGAVLRVTGRDGTKDETREIPIAWTELTDAEMLTRQQRPPAEREKEAEQEDKERRVWMAAAARNDATAHRGIWISGETLTIDPRQADLRRVRVLKDGETVADIPLPERQRLTAQGLMDGETSAGQPLDIILPNGHYELEMVRGEDVADIAAAGGPGPAAAASGTGPALARAAARPPAALVRTRRQVEVGQDRLMFVAMGDGKAGFNTVRGNIEPVQSSDKYRRGFYREGKMAYYLKGKVLGKYLLTSSFDSERQQKEMFRTVKSDDYYPVYGDNSQVNYDATNTQGPLYLMLEWDKSQAIWGNYAVDFKDTEFAQFSRTLYGGKVDYTSVAANPYGDPKTRVVFFHAEVRQRSAHNEFLGTGGSLYYLKHRGLVPGSLKLRLETRDSETGQVRSTTELKEGVDFEPDNDEGRLLFWQPVAMAADSGRLIGNDLLNGDPVYVVADYEYYITDKIAEGTQGVRVAQGVGKSVVVGGTYVTETQPGGDYRLQGQDITVHAGPNTTLRAEYAGTDSRDSASYVSTDGGITFSELSAGQGTSGRAFALTQDSRLFDRLGVKSYHRWAENSFASSGSVSKQGKSATGLALTFDLTPATRLTASHDIQRLIDGGNLQTAMQVGAQETTTTLMQIVHDARRLRLEGELRRQQVRSPDPRYRVQGGWTSTAGVQAEYDLNERTTAKIKYQVDPAGQLAGDSQLTTGLTRQITDKLSATVEQTVGTQGAATKVAATANVTPKLAVTTDYTVAKARGSQAVQTRTTAVTGAAAVGEKTSVQTTYSMTQSDAGPVTTAVGVAAGTQVTVDDATLKAQVTAASDGKNIAVTSQGAGLEASKVDPEGRRTTGGVNVEESPSGQKTTVTLGDEAPLAPGRTMAAERTYTFAPGSEDHGDTYKVAQEKDGRKLEGSVTRKLSDTQAAHTDTNIFGLSGDINDRVAANASLETGKVMNVDGSVYSRVAVSVGAGYVGRDADGREVLKSSTKVEGRLDRGAQSAAQAVLTPGPEGKVNEETTLTGKLSLSRTWDRASGETQASYKEIVLGAAYRPVLSDRLNLFGRYTYKEDQGPAGQANTMGVEKTRMHVLAAEGAYDLTDRWQLVEKLALRVMEEKVTGFDFTKTHTWLLVNRVNYRIDRDWKVGAEQRTLVQREARDRRLGGLVEAVRSVNDNVELGIGYSFTDFVDDLTSLSHTVQGPYIRMTGKLYDRTPEERAQARQRWIDRRVEHYAWEMVSRELNRKDSSVVAELNDMFRVAHEAEAAGQYETSRRLYQHLVQATQMMYEEAAAFVRRHIAFEEKIFNAYQRAREYYDQKDYWMARKLWEKIVEEAEKAMLQ